MKKTLAMLLAMMLLLAACNTGTEVEETEGENTPAAQETEEQAEETEPEEETESEEEEDWEEEEDMDIVLPDLEPVHIFEDTGITVWQEAGVEAKTLFDRDQTTNCSGTVGGFIVWSLPEAVVPTSYILVNSFDAGTEFTCIPSTWTLYGCTAEDVCKGDYYSSNWTKLDWIQEDETIEHVDYQSTTFSIAGKPEACQYFMLEVDAAVREGKPYRLSEVFINYDGAADPGFKSAEEMKALQIEKRLAKAYTLGYVDAVTPTPIEGIEWISGNEDFEGYGSYTLTDYNLDTKWCTNKVPCECVWKMPEPIAVTGYQFVTANGADLGRNPVDWTLYGSNDGENWEVVDSRAGVRDLLNEHYLAYDFWLEEKAPAYTYYKYECTKVVNGNLCELSGINLFTDGNYTVVNKTQEERDAISIKHGYEAYQPYKPGVTAVPIEGIEWISGNEDFEGYGSDKLTDYNADTKWCTNVVPCEAVWKMPEPIAVTGYQFITADGANYGRNPVDWTLYGSNDGENWEIVDQVSGYKKMLDTHYLSYDFWLAKQSAAYTYFKFECTKVVNGNLCELSALNLLAPGFYSTSPDYKPGVAVTPIEGIEWISGNEEFEGYGSDKLTDYDKNTKWCTNVVPCEAVWKMPEPIAVTGYQFITADGPHLGRNPVDWTLYGSNDGENWEVVDAVTGYDKMLEDHYLSYDFWLKEKAATYTYFKFECTKVQNGNLCELSALNLLTDGNYTPAE